MENNVAEQEEQYIKQAVLLELGEIEEGDEDERLERVRFWQGRSGKDRFRATGEIVKRVHLARGGSITDLRVNKSIMRLVRQS